MAYYLISARVKPNRIERLRKALADGSIASRGDSGPALAKALVQARIRPNNTAVWEQEDRFLPPLMQERREILEEFFDDVKFTEVQEGSGWERIARLPRLFYSLSYTGNLKSSVTPPRSRKE